MKLRKSEPQIDFISSKKGVFFYKFVLIVKGHNFCPITKPFRGSVQIDVYNLNILQICIRVVSLQIIRWNICNFESRKPKQERCMIIFL